MSQIYGKSYAENLCLRTLNQTIGRAIRGKDDKAEIWLLDERFKNYTAKLPLWLQ